MQPTCPGRLISGSAGGCCSPNGDRAESWLRHQYRQLSGGGPSSIRPQGAGHVHAMRLDILFVADVRFEGGTSTALAVEIRAAARAGLKTGLLAVKGPLLGHPFPMHPGLACADRQRRHGADRSGHEGRGRPRPAASSDDHVQPHHPADRRRKPSAWCWFFTIRWSTGSARFSTISTAWSTTAIRLSGCRSCWPQSARSFAIPCRGDLPAGSELLAEDWTNLIDLDDWPQQGGAPTGQSDHHRPPCAAGQTEMAEQSR